MTTKAADNGDRAIVFCLMPVKDERGLNTKAACQRYSGHRGECRPTLSDPGKAAKYALAKASWEAARVETGVD